MQKEGTDASECPPEWNKNTSIAFTHRTQMHRCFMQDEGQGHLVDKLTKTVGFGMGLEFRESANSLSATNSTPVRAGMVFNVSIGAFGHCPCHLTR